MWKMFAVWEMVEVCKMDVTGEWCETDVLRERCQRDAGEMRTVGEEMATTDLIRNLICCYL